MATPGPAVPGRVLRTRVPDPPLGELSDQSAALGELCRVLKPDGQLVVGELFGDPHRVSFGALTARAETAGLRLKRRLGGPLGYYARFRQVRHRRDDDVTIP
jgi:hypothetical protein